MIIDQVPFRTPASKSSQGLIGDILSMCIQWSLKSTNSNTQFLLCPSVTKNPGPFSLIVFLKYDRLDLFKASDSISDYLTSVFPKNLRIF